MIFSNILYASIVLSIASANKLSSSKRGLISIPSSDGTDNNIWTATNSDLTWYYNYGSFPTAALANSKLQFVPMLWGKPSNTDPNFHHTVTGLIDGGMQIQYILGFNEPDGCSGGGSCVSAEDAAQIWIDQIEPLKHLNIQLGAPAVTSATSGADWLAAFYSHCNGRCTTDFLPLHWYGDFTYLPDYIGGMKGTYKNMSTIWITEYAYPDVPLEMSQLFFNQSTGYFDNTSYITHYSYFGSFRADVSNVGPNVAMLDNGGQLTDIGAWYLGRHATGNLPTSNAMMLTRITGWMALVFGVIVLQAIK